MKDYIQFLYAYNQWANERIFDACAELSQQEFLAGQGSSTADASIRDTLTHLVGAQELWLARWGGNSPTTILQPQAFGTAALLRQYWEQVERHTRAYLDAIEEDVLRQAVVYKTTQGIVYTHPRWQLLAHQANHATQHRSEIAMLLTRLNHSPGDLDMLAYMRRG